MKFKNRKDQVRALGSYGEFIVANYFETTGCIVKRSEDWFDDEKDMIVDGQTVEVKTLMPIYKYNAFCLPAKQAAKCESVDRLIFVKIPAQPGDDVKVYESITDEDAKRRYDFRETFNNEHCLFYRLTFLQELISISNAGMSQYLFDLSPSEYKGCFYETRIDRGS